MNPPETNHRPLAYKDEKVLESNTALTSTVSRRGEVATTVEISGRASDLETSPWALAVSLIQNAFVKAIARGFERDQVTAAKIIT